MDTIELKLDDSNKLTVYLHGATITSWVSHNKEILFLSKKSVFDNKKAIRGGIPVVFPNFGPWANGPQHGFARIKKWSVKQPASQDSESASLTLSLSDDEETRKMWNHSFELLFHIKLTKDSLDTKLTITNTGNDDFEFTCLLHTYFSLNSINDVKIHDLSGFDYVDKVKNGIKVNETNDSVVFTEETDRVYISTGDSHQITEGNNKIMLKKENLPDTVVWNPWIEKSKAMADFDDDEYKVMVCVEAGYVNSRYLLKSKQSVQMGQTILAKI